MDNNTKKNEANAKVLETLMKKKNDTKKGIIVAKNSGDIAKGSQNDKEMIEPKKNENETQIEKAKPAKRTRKPTAKEIKEEQKKIKEATTAYNPKGGRPTAKHKKVEKGKFMYSQRDWDSIAIRASEEGVTELQYLRKLLIKALLMDGVDIKDI